MNSKVRKTVQVSSNITSACEECGDWGKTSPGFDADITPRVNHYIEAHGYEVLHVGQETSHTNDGKLWHSTVAVLGKP